MELVWKKLRNTFRQTTPHITQKQVMDKCVLPTKTVRHGLFNNNKKREKQTKNCPKCNGEENVKFKAAR